jgi:hypothetical protein
MTKENKRERDVLRSFGERRFECIEWVSVSDSIEIEWHIVDRNSRTVNETNPDDLERLRRHSRQYSSVAIG